MQEDNTTLTQTPPVDPMNTPEVNQAAHTFYTSVPRIKSLATSMGGKGLARVFKAIVEFPLADNYPKFRSKSEQELFILTLSVMSAKNTMTSLFTSSMDKRAIEDEITDGVVSEILAEVTNKEELNG